MSNACKVDLLGFRHPYILNGADRASNVQFGRLRLRGNWIELYFPVGFTELKFKELMYQKLEKHDLVCKIKVVFTFSGRRLGDNKTCRTMS